MYLYYIISHQCKCGNKNNRVNKMTTLNSIHLKILLYCITLTSYCIAKGTFRSQVMTAM